MSNPYQVLTAVPGPTIIADFFFPVPSLTERFIELTLELKLPFSPFCPGLPPPPEEIKI